MLKQIVVAAVALTSLTTPAYAASALDTSKAHFEAIAAGDVTAITAKLLQSCNERLNNCTIFHHFSRNFHRETET